MAIKPANAIIGACHDCIRVTWHGTKAGYGFTKVREYLLPPGCEEQGLALAQEPMPAGFIAVGVYRHRAAPEGAEDRQGSWVLLMKRNRRKTEETS